MICINFNLLANNTNKSRFVQKGMRFLNKTIIILISIFFLVALGVFIGVRIYDNNIGSEYSTAFDNNMIIQKEDIEIQALEASNMDEKTTPNTLIIYKTYYTKCKHYVQEYEDIDASLVNLTEEEFKEKCKNCDIEKFSNEEVLVSKIEEGFCGQHYKLKLQNSTIVIYNIDENGLETEYEHTGITTEYLTEEDIAKLAEGIYIYGKENLTSTIEDYE